LPDTNDILSSITGDVPNESYWFFAERSLICSQAHSTTAFVSVFTGPTLYDASKFVYFSCSALCVCFCMSLWKV